MKVKIGDKVYDANDQPIMLIMGKKDKWNIEHMSPDATRYCAYPEDTPVEVIKAFMNPDIKEP